MLAALAEGLGNKSIARRLGISEHTVKTHVAALFAKLDVSGRTVEGEGAARRRPDEPPPGEERRSSERRDFAASVLDEGDVFAEFVRREWCDGLPIVAPTRARVDAMLAGRRADPVRLVQPHPGPAQQQADALRGGDQ